jgi:hypothetical protein
MHLTLLGPIIGSAETTQANGQHTLVSTTLSGRISIRLSDVRVNGVPLAAGTDCHTTEPQTDNFTLVGSGDNSAIPPTGYTVARGGPLTGTTAIGAFAGPNNYVKMIQGNLCSPGTGGANGCPPEIPAPQR